MCINETKSGIRKKKSNKLDWDETLPPHIDKLFKEWIEDLKFVDEFKTTRYVFGTKDGVFETPPPRKLLEMHAFSDGGNDAYGIVIYLHWKSNGSYQMKRIYAASRIVSKSNNMSVPRKELNGIVLAVKKALEFAAEFNIAMENVYLHTDSLICLYWIEKQVEKLTTYVHNRVKIIQDSGLSDRIYYTNSNTNVADLVTKIKPLSSYINNHTWEHGPKYMEDENWYTGRSIQEIHQSQHPSLKENEEIEKETRKVRINFTKINHEELQQNVVSVCSKRSNDLKKIIWSLRKVITAILFFKRALKKFRDSKQTPERGGESENNDETTERQRQPNKLVWALYGKNGMLVLLWMITQSS